MLELSRVSHAYGEIVALRDFSLQVEPGEILCLLGPSGCGKTTLLRVIAGLEPEYDGDITLHGINIRPIPVHQREFGFMFQDFALFPHMSVAKNIAYGLKRRRCSRNDIDRRVQELLSRVGLDGLEQRDVAMLSGGQKQRVALARSLAPNPRLLMLDEPLGSLDAQLRDELALELRRIIKSEGLSAIYVTHDLREAYAVADRIGIMNVGSLQQHDRPRELYRNPKTDFVARFLGMQDIFSVHQNEITKALASVLQDRNEGTDIFLIHPDGIRLADRSITNPNNFKAELQAAVFRGGHFDVTVSLEAGLHLHFSLRELSASVGDELTIHIASDAIKPLSRQSTI